MLLQCPCHQRYHPVEIIELKALTQKSLAGRLYENVSWAQLKSVFIGQGFQQPH